MKKSYLMIAAAAALFAACSNVDTFKEVNEESPIKFEQALNKNTRAYISSEADLATPGFQVYGYKTATKTNNVFDWAAANVQTIFNGQQKVYSSDQGSTWKYDNLRFWDKNASYNFYAIAPYAPSTGVSYGASTNSAYNVNTNHLFQIAGASSKLYTQSDDYLIDRDGAKAVEYTTNNGTAAFDFHHVMAKVDFKLKSTLSTGYIVVSSLTMSGWDNATGTFNQASTTTPTTLTKDEWTLASAVPGVATLIPSTVKSGAWSDSDPQAGQATVKINCASTSPTEVVLSDWWIMVPQQIASGDLTFTLTYTYYDGNGYSEQFVDQVATVSNKAQIWGTDSHTTYTLDIKPNAIDFDVTSVCQFDVDGNAEDANISDPVNVQ